LGWWGNFERGFSLAIAVALDFVFYAGVATYLNDLKDLEELRK